MIIILNETGAEPLILNDLTKEEILRAIQRNLTKDDLCLCLACDTDEMKRKELKGTDLTTLNEYLERNHISLSVGDRKRLETTVAASYKETYGRKPRRTSRPDSKGRWVLKSYGYTHEEIAAIVAPLVKFVVS